MATIRKRLAFSFLTIFAGFSIALIATVGAAHAQGANTILMNRVEHALRADRRLNGAAAYTASPGIIVLYGRVFDEHDSSLAERTAARVRGVRHVINTLRTMTGQWREEESRINDTLQLNDLQNVSAKVIGQEVYLSGQVSSEDDEQRAMRVVSSISKFQVVNFIRVVPGPLFSIPNF